MNILIVNTFHYNRGGDTRYAFSLARLLGEHGHRVRFFSMKHPDNIPTPDERYFVDTIDFAELNSRKSPRAAARILSRAIYSRQARKRIGLMLDDYQPDVVHLHNIHGHITPSILFEIKRRGLPVCWTLHDYKLICPNSHFLNDRTGRICEACTGGRFYQTALKRCKKGSLAASLAAGLEAYAHRALKIRARVDAFHCPSRFLLEKFIANGYRKPRFHHIPLFLEEDALRLSPDSEGFLLYFGRITGFKGLRTLIRAAEKNPDIPLVIAGSPGREPSEDILERLPSHITCAGWLDPETRLPETISRCTAVVMPSLIFENQPYGILEGFARGKPVIASDLGGMRELVLDSGAGLLARPGDIEDWADKMRTLIHTPGLAGDLGRRGFEYAGRIHGGGTHLRAMLELYEKIRRL